LKFVKPGLQTNKLIIPLELLGPYEFSRVPHRPVILGLGNESDTQFRREAVREGKT